MIGKIIEIFKVFATTSTDIEHALSMHFSYVLGKIILAIKTFQTNFAFFSIYDFWLSFTYFNS